MAIPWTNDRAGRVGALMEEHPLERGCAALGRALLPVAREQDPSAVGIVIRASAGQTRYPCIETRGRPPLYWFHHVTVGLLEHCVDALTGVPGTRQEAYLDTHFANAPDLSFDPTDPDLEDASL